MAEIGLSSRFMRGLAAAPERPAIRVDGSTLSYSRTHEWALSLASAMRKVTDGLPIAVLAVKSAPAYVGVLAALYAGATVVPLHAEFPAARTRQMLQDAKAGLVLADERGLAALKATELDLPVITPDATGSELAEPVPVQPSAVACILFTSGSTGRPKGVPLTYGMLDHYFRLADRRYDFTADDVFSQTFELNFDCALFDMFCAWGAGAAIQAVPQHAYRDLPGFIAHTGLTVWFSAPSVISLVRRMGGLEPGSMPSLRWSLFAGEALRAADVTDWLAAADRATLENIYGPTELTLTITGHRWSPDTSPGLCVNGLVPIGTLHEGHEYLLLTEDGTISPDEGELCVTGPQMTPGYLDPAHDEGRFLEHDGRRWYRTGDRIRRLPNDELMYLGRLDSQVQINGMRVELAEIEHAMRSCAGVQDAVAVAKETDHGVQLAVFYTGTPSPPAELVRQLHEVLPAGMMPKRFQHLEEFPLNSNRKIDRKQLGGW